MGQLSEYDSPAIEIVEISLESTFCNSKWDGTEGLDENGGSWDFDW